MGAPDPAGAARAAWERAAPGVPLPGGLLRGLAAPLAEAVLSRHRQAGRTVVAGLLGPQGCGKTTGCAVAAALLGAAGLRAECLSLDDFYLPASVRRRRAAREAGLDLRGPPGTHDVARALAVLDALRSGRRARVPVFDKSLHGGEGDRSGFRTAGPADAVILEGWMVGLRPVPPGDLEAALAAAGPGADGEAARRANARLAAYAPLWDRLDLLWVLRAPGPDAVRAWRREAEARMRAAGREGMGDDAVDAFVGRFLQALPPEVFLPALLARPGAVDRVLDLDGARRVFRGTGPGGSP